MMNLYCVYDTVAQKFYSPFTSDSVGVAVRSFNTFCSSSPFSRDFRLFRLGEFDLDTGIISPLSSPEFICNFEVKSDV